MSINIPQCAACDFTAYSRFITARRVLITYLSSVQTFILHFTASSDIENLIYLQKINTLLSSLTTTLLTPIYQIEGAQIT